MPSKPKRAPKPAARSKKAGRPPQKSAQSPQARRRQKSASAAYSKGTTLFQGADMPQVLPGVSRPITRKPK